MNNPKIITITERVHQYAIDNEMEHCSYQLVRACYEFDIKHGLYQN